MRTGLIQLAVAAGLLLGSVPLLAEGDSPSVRPSIRIAVVDLKKVIDSYRRSKDLDAKIEELKASLRQKISDQESKVAKMTQALKFLKNPGPEWATLRDNIQEEKAQLAAMTEQGDTMVRELFRSYVVLIFEDVQKAIAETAEKDGFDLVFKTEEPGLSGHDERELSLKLNMKSVLYGSRLDVTDRIIRTLNTEYERITRGKAAGSETPKK